MTAFIDFYLFDFMLVQKYWIRERERERERERQTDRQTDRQTETEIETENNMGIASGFVFISASIVH